LTGSSGRDARLNNEVEMDDRTKLAFAGAAWIDAARDILRELAAEHGVPGARFCLSERFTDAPADVAPDGAAAWHFRIEGCSVSVAAGDCTDADVRITADYQKALPTARLVYTPEILARRAANPAAPRPGVDGDMSKAPAYLTELHNRLAVITA
jgi:hypothetical protein